MMTTTSVQLRGNCPCCGKEQAVTKGGMSKHGYTVDNGWFQGICSGEGRKPMQVERTVTEQIVADVRAQLEELEATLVKIEAGEILPKTITRGSYKNEVAVPYAEGEEWEKSEARRKLEWNTRLRIRAGHDFADGLESILNRVHGTALIEVEKKAPATPICKGEKRINNGRTLTARYQQGARVYYNWVRDNGSIAESWIGTQAWRKLETI